MVELLRPVELDRSLEERIEIGGKKFVVGVCNAHFSTADTNIFGDVYAREIKPKEKYTTQIFGVCDMLITWNSFAEFVENLNNKIRGHYKKVLDRRIGREPFYDALENIYKHYQNQNEDSRIVL